MSESDYMANPSSQGGQIPPIQVPQTQPGILPIHDQSPSSTSSNLSPRFGDRTGIKSSGHNINRRHPCYKGIRSRGGKWVSEIRQPRKTTRIWLGTYPTPEMAAAAYDVAAIALKGPETPLNFPESLSSYPIPISTSPSSIRVAASAAAATRLPRSESEVSSDVGRVESEATVRDEIVGGESSGGEFIDEEMLLNMPNLLVDMAGAMMVSPPRINSHSSDDSPGISDAENLWSYQ
ncbi:hypothetical protein K2173_026628 [Erythroxylum novogranatense]|uniref:AP2/ERF domain-containing protein n=1 Tax=Erythroxylum novogranatense TaxID=1862640 RepID=A0AAV8TY33_9ROSI|nr:hypothetical protein K2173_026628 [Erythroxylum novogranatense]